MELLIHEPFSKKVALLSKRRKVASACQVISDIRTDAASGAKHGAQLFSGKIMETAEKINFTPIVNMKMGMCLIYFEFCRLQHCLHNCLHHYLNHCLHHCLQCNLHYLKCRKSYCCDGTNISFEPEDFDASEGQPGCECGDGYYRNTLNG